MRLTKHSDRRGAVIVAMVLVMLLVGLIIIGAVLGGARDQDLTMQRVYSMRAFYAAEAGTNMAIREEVLHTDADGDGTIGSISNDGNNNNDPSIGTAYFHVSTSTSGTDTTMSCQARSSTARRGVSMVARATAGVASAGTVLLVVNDSTSPDGQETFKKTTLQGWGYTVNLISATASQAAFDAAVLTSSAVYISETVNSGDLASKLVNTTLGVVDEEAALSDEFGFSSDMATFTDNRVNITNNTHYITSTFTTGSRTLFTATQLVRYLSGTFGGFTMLGQQVGTSNATLAVFERGDTLTPSGTAAGRRVYLPWGNTSMDITNLNADGLTMMQRSVEWVLLPVAYWKLDDASGSTAVDSIAARNGTLTNGPTWQSGISNGCLKFDGVDDYVTIANNNAFKVTNALTVAGWVRQTAAWPTGSTVCIILRKGDANPNNWQLAISGGHVELSLDTNDGSGIQGSTALGINQWIHVAGTWDGVKGRIYVNGVLDNTPTAHAAPIATDTRPLYLGGRIGSTDVVTGTVDDIRFYNRALTAGEIAALAQATPTLMTWQDIVPQ